MKDNQIWEKWAGRILSSFFEDIRYFVESILSCSDNYMECLKAFQKAAWDIPKKFKGNSAQLGFIPEYLVFELMKQVVEKKMGFEFKRESRTRLADKREETAYFVDRSDNPSKVLIQGLKIAKEKWDLPLTQYQHDVTYMVLKEGWKARAVVEVKGFFDKPSLEADLSKLNYAKQNYPTNPESLFAFIGFIPWDNLSPDFKVDLEKFAQIENNFVILPGGSKAFGKNGSLEEFLKRL